jgi:hypothetical protein
LSTAAAFLALLLTNFAAAETLPIAGRWQLDPSQSTEATDVLKGIRESKRVKRDDEFASAPRAPGSAPQRRYWEEANAGKEWRHTQELEHDGPLQRLLESQNLEIVGEGDGYLFIYADGYERLIVPNPGGRVFTASGEELVKTEIGFTLAFWDGAALAMETGIKRGGKLNERVTTSDDGNTLTIAITIDRRDWKWIAKVERVFKRVAAD